MRSRGSAVGTLTALALAGLIPLAVACNRKSSDRKIPAFDLRGAAYLDANENGLVDPGDTVTITFDLGVLLQGAPPADSVFAIDPPGSFGSGATVSPVSATDLEVTLQAGASLQPNGTYGSSPDSTGLNLVLGQTDITDPTGVPVPARSAPVDLGGEANPRITSVAVVDTNGSCRIDSGDEVSVSFTANVSLTTPDPNQAFLLLVTGDTLGTGAQFSGGGAPLDTGSVNIVIGAGAIFETVGTFDPLNLTPGSPSGIDVVATAGAIVDARHAAVSAVPHNPPGEDLAAGGASDLLWSSVGDDSASAEFGYSAASAGDVDNDGYPDVIVGGPGFEASSFGAGKAYVYLGGAGGLSTTPIWTSIGDDQGGADFGSSVASAGDVNGDGFDDVIVGAQWYDDVNQNAGKAYLYLGGPAGPSTSPDWTSSGDQLGSDRYGVNVASAGDVNADGFSDIVVAASHYPSTTSFVGKVYLYHGGPGGPSITADWSSIGDDQLQANYGLGCSGAGDVNGDGFSDVIVGAPGFDTANGNAGKAYVYLGGLAGLDAIPAWTSVGDDQASSQFGSSVSSAGDVDNDGYSDVIIGADIFGPGMLGKAYVYLGGPTGPATSPVWTSSGDSQTGARYGTTVSTAGDVNNDGFSDIVVGVPLFDTPAADAGKAYLYLGGTAGPSVIADWTSSGDDRGDSWFGISVASGGDFDGNGFYEILVGASLFDTTNPDAGKAYIYCGR